VVNTQVPKEVLGYIAEEISKTQFGTVTIELSENKKAIDVVTTCRKRFPKSEQCAGEKRETMFRNG